jgi:hypothetical protein
MTYDLCIKLLRCGAIAVALGGILAIGSAPRAAEPKAAAISADASGVVARMGKSLSANQFSFKAWTLRVYADSPKGQPLHVAHTMNVTVRRPDRLAVDVTGDDGRTRLLYDGKTTVVFNPDSNRYASVTSPNTIQAMIDQVMGKLGVDFPLANFINDAPDKAFLEGVTSGDLVNTVTIDGTPCVHLIFNQPGTELELWVEQTERAVPRRLIVTYTALPDRPNFIAELSDWNFDAQPADSVFTFQPPAGATQVEFKPAKTAPPAKKG